MAMFSNHLSSFSKYNEQLDIPCTSNFIGTCFSVSLLAAFTPSTCWIMDLGSTRHIFYDAIFFFLIFVAYKEFYYHFAK